MKNKFFLFCIIFLALFTTVTTNFYTAYADSYVYLGGIPAGFTLETRGAEIISVGEVLTKDGTVSPSKDAGILNNDVILSIDGIEVNSASDIEKVLVEDGEKVLEIERKGEKIILEVVPSRDMSGKLKLGVFIKDSINGIGTLTFIKNNRFASLGHPIVNENGKLIEIKTGSLSTCVITGRVKGEKNRPGELCGTINKSCKIGNVDKNIMQGVYGELCENFNLTGFKKIKTGKASVGKAYIYSTVNGEKPEKYSVSIIKVENGNGNGKNFVLKVDDERLLELTNGIVQGMSGSPVVQNDKLVGAVTHVFINDSTRGFGISIDNMINN